MKITSEMLNQISEKLKTEIYKVLLRPGEDKYRTILISPNGNNTYSISFYCRLGVWLSEFNKIKSLLEGSDACIEGVEENIVRVWIHNISPSILVSFIEWE